MTDMTRRSVLAAALAAGLAAAGTTYPAAAADKVVRIGIQKYGKLILLRSKGSLEKALEPLGYKVTWTEFPAGPQLLEAINAGAVDFGNTGEAPPIFAQAAGAPIVYVAHEPPAPLGEAIVVPKDSAITSIADLKGKKVALNKGSNVHYLLVKALEKAGIPYGDIKPVFLTPADARAAFEKGAVDAWAIWDPFLASAEATIGARKIADGTGLVANHQFYFGSKPFVAEHAKALDVLIAELSSVDTWAKSDIKAVAAQLSPPTGIPAPVLETALLRSSFGIRPLDKAVIAEQQKVADAFLALGLLPKPIVIEDVVRRTGS